MMNLSKGLFLLIFFSLSAPSLAQTKEKLTVGAKSIPHAEMLEFIKPDLLSRNIALTVVLFADYITPNIALREGAVDANFFQHQQYFNKFKEDMNLDAVSVGSVCIELMGLYSKRVDSVSKLQVGATIAIPDDPTNMSRALTLLEAGGLIKLNPMAGMESNLSDIQANPKKLNIVKLDITSLVRTLKDMDAAVIDASFAMPAGLYPHRDAILVETPNLLYATVVVAKPDVATERRMRYLMHLLRSEKTKSFMADRYEKSVVPTF
ncbi:MetQ/NlpA family ABC transporter substrate-binding protein [Deferribacterales bacterium RsTz2092]|nr:outer membrane protein [Deferribacterales bacterium]